MVSHLWWAQGTWCVSCLRRQPHSWKRLHWPSRGASRPVGSNRRWRKVVRGGRTCPPATACPRSLSAPTGTPKPAPATRAPGVRSPVLGLPGLATCLWLEPGFRLSCLHFPSYPSLPSLVTGSQAPGRGAGGMGAGGCAVPAFLMFLERTRHGRNSAHTESA